MVRHHVAHDVSICSCCVRPRGGLRAQGELSHLPSTYPLPTLQGERNYHVFYMLCKAPSPVREPVGVTKWQDYTALNQKGTIEKVPY